MAQIPFTPEQEANNNAQAASIASHETSIAALQNGTLTASGSNAETSSTNGGAISISKLLTNITSAGVETRTLALPSAPGQIKIIVMTAYVGAVTITTTNIVWGFSSLVFNEVGETTILMSAGGLWHVLGGTNV